MSKLIIVVFSTAGRSRFEMEQTSNFADLKNQVICFPNNLVTTEVSRRSPYCAVVFRLRHEAKTCRTRQSDLNLIRT